MSRQVDSRNTTTSYWESVIKSVGHPTYAPSSIFEEGPEFARGNTLTAEAVFNKAACIELHKLFNPRLSVWDNDGESIASQIWTVLTDRVGRNRKYTAKDLEKYFAEAASRYALLGMIRNALKVSSMVPRIAVLNNHKRDLEDIYDRYYNSINTNFPLPESMAKYVEEYVIPILEDKNDDFNKGLILFTNELQLRSTIDSTVYTFRAIQDSDDTISNTEIYLAQTPSERMAEIARDIASFVKIKSIGERSAVTIYPLDAKHRASIINVAKFNYLAFDSSDEPEVQQQGDDVFGVGPAPTSQYVPGGTLRMSKTATEKNINFWDSVGMPIPVGPGATSLENLACIQGIYQVMMRTASGQDEERFVGSMTVGYFNHNDASNYTDETQLMVEYQDIFGGWALATGDPDPDDHEVETTIFTVTVEAFGTESVSLTTKQLAAIKLIALQEIFNVKINVKQSEEQDS